MAKHENNGNCAKCQEFISKANPILRNWFEGIQKEIPEAHVSYAYRGKQEQDKFFREGKSKAKFGQSPHNYYPALALDIFFLIDGKGDWSEKRYEAIEQRLVPGIKWGKDFKGLRDLPHFELLNWKILAKDYPNGNKLD